MSETVNERRETPESSRDWTTVGPRFGNSSKFYSLRKEESKGNLRTIFDSQVSRVHHPASVSRGTFTESRPQSWEGPRSGWVSVVLENRSLRKYSKTLRWFQKLVSEEQRRQLTVCVNSAFL